MTCIVYSEEPAYLEITKERDLILQVLCTYPVIPSFVYVCIYFEWFPLWLFLELDSL